MHLIDEIIWTSDAIRSHNFSLNPMNRDEDYRPPCNGPYIDHLWGSLMERYNTLMDTELPGSRRLSVYDEFLLTLVQGFPIDHMALTETIRRVKEDLSRYHGWLCEQSGLASDKLSQRFWHLQPQSIHRLWYTEGCRLGLTQKG